MNTVDQRVVNLDRKWHLAICSVFEHLAKHHSRNGLPIVLAARVFEAGERYPWNGGVVDQVDTLSFDVEGFQSFILLAGDLSHAVELEDIVSQGVVTKRKCLVVVKNRLRRIDAGEFDHFLVQYPKSELTDLICGLK